VNAFQNKVLRRVLWPMVLVITLEWVNMLKCTIIFSLH
jgi:hypothetical protein